MIIPVPVIASFWTNLDAILSEMSDNWSIIQMSFDCLSTILLLVKVIFWVSIKRDRYVIPKQIKTKGPKNRTKGQEIKKKDD